MTNQILTSELKTKIYRDRKIRVAITQKSHLLFFHIYFAKYVTCETAQFQKEIFAITENQDVPLGVVVAFRGSGKSTIMTMSYPIWSILGEPQKKFVVILSQTQRQAQQHLTNLKRELEQNDLLRSDLGPFSSRDDQWGALALDIPKYNARIIAASTEQSIRGLRHGQYRPDLIICDDVENLESVKTKDSRDKTHQWLVGDVIPAGDINTRVMIVGNLLHEDSVLMRLKEGIESNALDGLYRAYPLLDTAERSAWSGKYPNAESIEILKRRVGNDIAWHREFLLHIISDSERVVHPDWIHFYDVLPRDDYHFSAIGIDLAISLRTTADYTAMVPANVYGWDDDMKIYILPNPVNKRLTFPDAIETAKQLSKSIHSDTRAKLFVEDIAYQKAFVQQLQDEGYDVEGAQLGRLDKRERLAMTTHLIKSGRILFPVSGAEALIRQLTDFGVEKHDDLVDAFSTLILKIIDHDFHSPRISFISYGADDDF